MPLGRRAIGEGSGLRLTARADPPPAGFDLDHAKEVEAGGDAVAPANVAGRVERHQLDRIRQRKVRAEHGAEPTKSALRSPTTYLTQWRVADSRAESMRMRSGAEIARYDRPACSIAGHRANEWAGCARCSTLIVPPLATTITHTHHPRGTLTLGRAD